VGDAGSGASTAPLTVMVPEAGCSLRELIGVSDRLA
jgi:hypothetical protein